MFNVRVRRQELNISKLIVFPVKGFPLEIIPQVPGVYLFFSQEGSLLYIGKSTNLRRRLADHKRSWSFLKKRSWLRGETPWSFSLIFTSNSLEASQLEFQLIKEWQPLYNIKDNDEEEPQVISLDLDEIFPALRLESSRYKASARTYYLGPFVFLRRIYLLYNLLLTKFKLRRCKDNQFRKGSRGCLFFQIRRCLGPCFQSREVEVVYDNMVQDILKIFHGKTQDLRYELRLILKEKVKSMDFESASSYFHLIKALRYLSQRLTVILPVGATFMQSEGTKVGASFLKLTVGYERGLLTKFDITLEPNHEYLLSEKTDTVSIYNSYITKFLRLNLKYWCKILKAYKLNSEEVYHVGDSGSFHQRFYHEQKLPLSGTDQLSQS